MPEPKRREIGNLPILSEYGSESTPYLVANDHDNQETGLVAGYGLVSQYLDNGLNPNYNYTQLNEYLSTHTSGGGGEVTVEAMAEALEDAPQRPGSEVTDYEFLLYKEKDDDEDADDSHGIVRVSLSEAATTALGELRYLSDRYRFGENCEFLVRNTDSFVRADASAVLADLLSSLPSGDPSSSYSFVAYGPYYDGEGEEGLINVATSEVVTLSALNSAISDLPSALSNYSYDMLAYGPYYNGVYYEDGLVKMDMGDSIITRHNFASVINSTLASTATTSFTSDYNILVLDNDEVRQAYGIEEYFGVDSHFFPQNLASVYDDMSEYSSPLAYDTCFVVNANGSDSNWPKYVTLETLMSYIRENINNE
jgi:hypothetical protein